MKKQDVLGEKIPPASSKTRIYRCHRRETKNICDFDSLTGFHFSGVLFNIATDLHKYTKVKLTGNIDMICSSKLV